MMTNNLGLETKCCWIMSDKGLNHYSISTKKSLWNYINLIGEYEMICPHFNIIIAIIVIHEEAIM